MFYVKNDIYFYKIDLKNVLFVIALVKVWNFSNTVVDLVSIYYRYIMFFFK